MIWLAPTQSIQAMTGLVKTSTNFNSQKGFYDQLNRPTPSRRIIKQIGTQHGFKISLMFIATIFQNLTF